MSDYRTEASPEFPSGRLVPLTDAEKAQRDADRAAGRAAAAATATDDANELTLRGRLASLLDTALAQERDWLTLTTAQKLDGALRTSLRMNIALARLLLRRLDNP